MRPFHSLLFLIFIGLSLLGLGEIFPSGIKAGGLEIQFYRFGDFLALDTSRPANRDIQDRLSKLEEKTNLLVEEDSIFNKSLSGDSASSDSAAAQLADVEFHIDSASGIQYPAGDSTILFSVFRQLDSAKTGSGLVRILHIGDSQIEGDRITGYLRQRLQQQYGGCGPGLLPIHEEIASRQYLRIQNSSTPIKYVLYGKPKPGPHSNYSVLHSYFRLLKDTSQKESAVKDKIQYDLNGQGYKRNNYFERATLLVRNSRSSLEVMVTNPDKSTETKRYTASDSLRMVQWPMKAKSSKFAVHVATGTETDLYGICLDCKSGVAVDNIPLRGSSGLDLLKINPRFLKEQIRRLGVKFVILQFGINVVPYASTSYSWYENSIVKAIQTIQLSAPGVCVLVVGVSDMALKKDGTWNSYETIPMVMEAQRNACRRTNSAFWDLYQVMGGKNSIIAWAKTSPPLAGKDYIHLTPRGAQVVGEFLYQSLQAENKKFKRFSIQSPFIP
jgi:lysophospholipase L1-like esterase